MPAPVNDPTAQAIRQRDGALWMEDVALESVAARFGTPVYVYSRAAIEARYDAFASAFAPARAHRCCYAVKANGNLAVLNVLARRGAGFDIVSGGELARVLRAGGDPRRVVFSGVAKSVPDIEAAEPVPFQTTQYLQHRQALEAVINASLSSTQ